MELVDPLTDISSYSLEQTPRHLVPHVPSLSPLPSSIPVHVSSLGRVTCCCSPITDLSTSPTPVARAPQVWMLSQWWTRMRTGRRRCSGRLLLRSWGALMTEALMTCRLGSGDGWRGGVDGQSTEVVSHPVSEHVRASALRDLLGERVGGVGCGREEEWEDRGLWMRAWVLGVGSVLRRAGAVLARGWTVWSSLG